MPSLRVVEDLEILEELGGRRGAGSPGGVVDELDLRCGAMLPSPGWVMLNVRLVLEALK